MMAVAILSCVFTEIPWEWYLH